MCVCVYYAIRNRITRRERTAGRERKKKNNSAQSENRPIIV